MSELLGRFKISTKLVMIALSFGLPIAVLSMQLIGALNTNIEFAAFELYGNAYQKPLEDVLRYLPEHARFAGNADTRAMRDRQGKIDAAFDALEEVDGKVGKALQFTPEGLAARDRDHLEVANLRNEWNSLKSSVTRLDNSESHDQHRHLLDDVRGMIAHAGDTSNLILDPDLDSYYMMDVTLLALPQTQDRIAGILEYGEAALGRGVLTSSNLRQFAVFAAQLREADYDRTVASTETSLNEDGHFYDISDSLQSRVPPALKSYQAKTEAFIQALETLSNSKARTVTSSGPGGSVTTLATDKFVPAVTSDDFAALGIDARDASFDLWWVGVEELDKMLEIRMDDYAGSRTREFLTSMLVVALAGFLTFLIHRSITGPIQAAVGGLEALAKKDLTQKAQVVGSDELAQIASAQCEAVDGIRAAMENLRASTMELSSSTQELQQIGHEMQSTACETSSQSEAASASVERINQHVQTIAKGVDELGASIREISENASKAVKVAGEAVNAAEETNRTITKLGDSSSEIGDVVKVITSIAEQTNLLALNATIEAARAGEAGKGFAVVANEVKELAKETADATENISRRIDTIQSDTSGAIEAITKIRGIIDEISDLQSSIAGAVEEQSATAEEIGRSVSQAAEGTSAIADNVNSVAASARGTSENATKTSAATESLSAVANQLEQMVSEFRL